MEIWKDIYYKDSISGKIIDYRGHYQVSSEGNIRNIKGPKPKNLKIKTQWDGYKYVNLSINNKKTSLKVHRLVAHMFIPNLNNEPQVNHKDENPANNKMENLEWCTPKYNSNYGNHCKNISESCSGKIKKGGVVALDKNTDEVIMWLPNSHANIPDGYNHRHINECCNGKRLTHKGYKWYYYDNLSDDIKEKVNEFKNKK